MQKMNAFASLLVKNGVELPSSPINLIDTFERCNTRRTYVILMTGRSGSTWLAAALKKLKQYGDPIEYFSEEAVPYYGKITKPEDFKSYFERTVLNYSTSGCFGFKTNLLRLSWLGKIVDIQTTFPASNCAWIDMRRWNLVNQAYSFLRAKKTGVWHEYRAKTDSKARDPQTHDQQDRFPDIDVWRNIVLILEQEQRADALFHGNKIDPLRIFYEEIYDSKVQLLSRVVARLGGDPIGLEVLESLEDGTNKLAKLSDFEEENYFSYQNAELLNEIYSHRSTFETARLRTQFKL